MPARWSTAVIDHNLRSRNIRQEEVAIANETGVKGRFQQAVGQTLGAVFRAENVNIRFSDFHSAGTGYRHTPDIALVSRSLPVTVKAVGEIKVPWVASHNLQDRYTDDYELRSAIGQVVEYMIDQQVAYDFHSTYEETIFLRQVRIHGVWRVEYSSIIRSQATGVSAKQCFWYLSQLAARGQPVNNPTPKDQLMI